MDCNHFFQAPPVYSGEFAKTDYSLFFNFNLEKRFFVKYLSIFDQHTTTTTTMANYVLMINIMNTLPT